MTKKTKNLIIAAVALVLAIGAYFITQKAEDKKEDFETSPAAPMVDITGLDASALRSVRIENSSGGVHIYSPDGNHWLVADVPEYYRSDSDSLKAVAEKFAHLRSRDIIAEHAGGGDLADFGLDVPKALVVLREKDGTETIVEFGKMSPSGAGRYVRPAGADRVFLLPSYQAKDAFSTPDTFRDRTLPAVSPDKLTGFSYRSGGILFALAPREGDHPYIKTAGRFDVVSPYRGRYPAGDYNINKALTQDTPLPSRIGEFIDSGDPNDPSFGLNEKSADRIDAEDSDGNALHLLIGAPTGTGSRYARLTDREGPVFTVENADLTFLNITPFQLTEKFLFLGAIDKVAEVTVNSGGESWLMAREDRGDPESVKDDFFTVNGREVPQKRYSEVYQNFIGLMWEGVADKKTPAGNPEISITVTNTDSSVTPMMINFWPYDEVYYLAAAGDAPREFLLGRYQVARMLESLKKLAEEDFAAPEPKKETSQKSWWQRLLNR